MARHAEGRTRAAEIGVFEGVNTVNIARCLDSDGLLYAVDPFCPGRLGINWSRRIAHREVRRAGLAPRVHYIRCLSWEAAEFLPDGFDFVFFDGDHSESGLRRDWAAWSGKILAGGIVAFHDAIPPDDTGPLMGSHVVFREVVSEDARFTTVDQVDSLAILRRD